MKTVLLTFLLIGTLALGVAVGLMVDTMNANERGYTPSAVVVDSTEGDPLLSELRDVRARLERLPPPTGDEEDALRSPRTIPYRVHREKGETLGVPRVTALEQIDSLVAQGRLVPLADTEYYTVRTLEHSAPFVTPDLHRLLDEIGQRFQEGLSERGLPPYRFVISSALRTPSLQEDLRDSNRNAASNASSHEYGVSVDIVIWRYRLDVEPTGAPSDPVRSEVLMAYGYRYWDHLFGLMTSIMTDLQREGAAVVRREDRQPVFHTTVARRFR